MRFPFVIAVLAASVFASAAIAQPHQNPHPNARPYPGPADSTRLGHAYRPAPPLHEMYRGRHADHFRRVSGIHALDRLWSPVQRRVLPLSRAAGAEVQIGRDGRVTFRTGCNTISTRLEPRGRGYAAAPASSTRRACQGISRHVEEAVLAVLPRIHAFHRPTARSVTFIDGRGNELMTISPLIQ